MDVKKEIKKLENSAVELTATIPQAEVANGYKDLLAKYAKSVQIPGFRKGHVPTNVLERKFGESLKAEALADLIDKTLQEIFEKDESIPQPLPYAQPTMDEAPVMDLEKDLTFTVKYDVMPEIADVKLDGITVEVPEVAIGDEEINEELKAIQERNALVVDKKDDDAAEKDNIVTVNYCELDDAGEVIKGTETTGTPTTPEYKTGDILNGSNIVDMPLYTVDLIGVDVQEPQRLFEIKKPMSEVFDLIYPVGSIYINTNDVNPAVLFGGTWERFAQGRTLVSIGSVRDDAGNVKTFEEGERGGEITHKLTTSELPAHSHNVKVDKLTTSAGRASHLAVSPILGDYSNFAADSVGSDVAHNNMQPYVAVYIWKRLS